jgi:hypothetical protein
LHLPNSTPFRQATSRRKKQKDLHLSNSIPLCQATSWEKKKAKDLHLPNSTPLFVPSNFNEVKSKRVAVAEFHPFSLTLYRGRAFWRQFHMGHFPSDKTESLADGQNCLDIYI